MSSPILAEIRMFAGNFAPRGWAFCDGQVLSISQNTALFSILGTTYGGDGQTTFALPDMRGRSPIHPGQGPGLQSYTLGEASGTEQTTLASSQMPIHQHGVQGSTNQQTTNRPTGAVPASGGAYDDGPPNAAMAPTAAAGGGQPHDNRSPYLAVSFIIALQGIFPSRN